MAHRAKQSGGSNVITVDDWRQALLEAQAARCDAVPEGWVDAIGLAEQLGISVRQGSANAQNLVKAGLAEARQYLVMGTNGIPRKVWHYRLLKR